MLSLLLAMYLGSAPISQCHFTSPSFDIISRSDQYIKLRVNVHCESGFLIQVISPFNNGSERQVYWTDTPRSGPIQIYVTPREHRSRTIRIIAMD